MPTKDDEKGETEKKRAEKTTEIQTKNFWWILFHLSRGGRSGRSTVSSVGPGLPLSSETGNATQW